MEKKMYMTEAQALSEANRCLHCYEAPCKSACPAGVNVPQFINRIATCDWVGAAQTIKEGNPLGLVCGLVCPSAELCRKDCNCGKLGESIRISDLQAYAMQKAVERGNSWTAAAGEKKDARVAVIGGGPSGVVAAALLAAKGYGVTLFEKADHLGGVPMDEIPNARLDKAMFDKEIAQLLAGGVEVRLNAAIDAAKAKEISAAYDAIYVACGLGDPYAGFETNAEGVMSAEAFLRLANSGKLTGVSGTVFVQGGGNTALDAAVTAKKLGAERSIICYRRSQLEMPAWEDEFVSAVKDGVEFLFQTQVLGADEQNGKVAGAVLAPVVLAEADASGRRKPVVQEDKRFVMAGSMILTATGKKKNADLIKAFDADKTFVGGDAENGGATVVQAVAEAKKAVEAIDSKLSK